MGHVIPTPQTTAKNTDYTVYTVSLLRKKVDTYKTITKLKIRFLPIAFHYRLHQ